ncbi:MAG: decarboxylase [Halobacteriovoraceae bacterium]|nr:decarboxylase [Halobacteriovoraceae bacterium]MCB9095322.1 decarboxylase [Halobacteriovoraceae bacterium]
MKKLNCNSEIVRLKANFLGPKAENADWLESEVNKLFSHWCQWRRNRFPQDRSTIDALDKNLTDFKDLQEKMSLYLSELNSRFEAETPTYSPRYMGHMVSELSLPAILGHLTGLIFNPNNTSKSVAKIGLEIEREAIEALSSMVGFGLDGRGHFTSGGTVANIEALWRARYRLDNFLSLGAFLNDQQSTSWNLFYAAHMGQTQFLHLSQGLELEKLKKYSFVLQGSYSAADIISNHFKEKFLGPVLLVPGHKHYSWQKALSLLGLGEESLWSIKVNDSGHLSVKDLDTKIQKAINSQRPILAIVSVSGTTELGMVDPIHEVQELLEEYKKKGIYIWHHVDGAYGGTYCSMIQGQGELFRELNPYVQKSLRAIAQVESITLDPHKLALVPYSCGAILVRDESCYPISSFKAPYLKENQTFSGKWDSTLEGSRASTGACATWMVAKSLGLNKEGLGTVLSLGLEAKHQLEGILSHHEMIQIVPHTDTNILCFTVAQKKEALSVSNKRTRQLYEKIYLENSFSVSQTILHFDSYGKFAENFAKSFQAKIDSEGIYLIRMVFMNPFTISQVGENHYLEQFSNYLQKLILDLED